MNYKYLQSVFCFILLLCSCSNDSEVPFEGFINITPLGEHAILQEGGQITVIVESNVDWTVNNNYNWINLQPDKGTSGTTTVTIDVLENENYETRKGILLFKNTEYALSESVIINQAEDTDTEERNALIALYNATDGDNWKDNSNWCSDMPLGEWYGVSTNNNGKVFRIDLYNNNLSGEIPADIGNLSNLKYLSLGNNKLTGCIPPELGNLSNLKSLSLGNNELTGIIPVKFGNLTNLESLNLSENQLSGSIPAELAALSNLGYLNLSNNQLTGNIPSEFANLANLNMLNLFSNQLTGEIPEFLSNIEYYENIDLTYNNFEGKLAPAIISHKDWNDFWPNFIIGNDIDMTDIKIYGPSFTVKDMDGNTIESSELYKKNKVTVLYKWGTWCGYSLEYNQTLISLYEKYKDDGFEILGAYRRYDISQPEGEYEYIKENIPWNNYLMYDNGHKKEIKLFKLIGYVPTVIVVDQTGEIILNDFENGMDRYLLPAVLEEYFE